MGRRTVNKRLNQACRRDGMLDLYDDCHKPIITSERTYRRLGLRVVR
jgi:hypothetical protein